MSANYSASDIVYFLRPVGFEGPIKIGCSYQPQSRLETMMSWSPIALEIVATCPGSFAEESKLHRAFSGSHDHGEWFTYTPELGEVIKRVAAGEPLPAVLAGMDTSGNIPGRGKLAWTIGRRAYQKTLTRAYAACKRGQKTLGHRLIWPPAVRQIADAAFRENRPLTEAEEAVLSPMFAEPETHFPPMARAS